ncbi:MAG: outer membrane protein transport protein [Kiritimatiellae bacterium]|nr:outer membrane protein transport protein [Kiritimatiellia bacterium]
MKARATVCGAAALFAAAAVAAGFGLYEMDAASTAMGGHVYGNPRNASAVYYNPGALDSLTGTVLTAGITMLNPRADARIDQRHDTRMNSGFLAYPNLFAVQELPLGFRLGLGAFGDFGLASKYNSHWELKHDSYETMLEGYTMQAVVSREILEGWSFGIGPRFSYVNFETRMVKDFSYVDQMYMAQSYGTMHAPARGRNKLKIQADNEDDVGIGMSAGTRYRVTDGFSLGAMYRSRVKTDLEGHARWTGGDTGHHVNSVKETIQLPAQITAGFNWDDALWIEDFHLGASLSWVEWSKMSSLRFDVWNPVSREVERNEMKMDWRNTYRAGFGMGYDFLDNWTVAGGYVYDWDPCRNNVGYAHSMLPVGDRHVITSGIVWTSDSQAWEIAFTYGIIIQESKSQYIPAEYHRYTGEVHKMHTHHALCHCVSVGLTYRF